MCYAGMTNIPLVTEIPFQDSFEVLLKLHPHFPAPVFLDSALQDAQLGRYSYIGIDPFQTVTSKDNHLFINDFKLTGNPFDLLQGELAKYKLKTLDDLPPFQGGAAGYFGYDLVHHLENVGAKNPDPLNFPDMAFGFYDVIIAFDLLEEKAWIFSNGFPELRAEKRHQRALVRTTHVQEILKKPYVAPTPPSHRLTWRPDISEQRYKARVQEAVAHIFGGTFSQCNYTGRWTTEPPYSFDPIGLYEKLRTENPAPFAGYFELNGQAIISASPERFLQCRYGAVETRPIKGTTKRSTDHEQDRALANALKQSEKDRAENVMIVDLMRNDLSKVCEDRSVDVPQLCQLETFATLHHLVSSVKGKLRRGKTLIDLIKATFPGGSITGTPKVKAMELIQQLEAFNRGPFYGNLGFIGFDGTMDLNILIRTFAYKANHLSLQVGGGIVADSDPQKEYEEMLLKAEALFQAASPDKAERRIA